MTSERIPRVTYSRRPYAFALVGVGLIVLAAWMNRGRLRPVGAGTVAPQFEVIDLGGNPARLSDYEGEVVMINIWATWCAPCRFEMPSMERLHQRFKTTACGFWRSAWTPSSVKLTRSDVPVGTSRRLPTP